MDLKSSNDIIWDGPNIKCLGLCKGDSISTVIYNIGTQVCDLIEELDPETVSLHCIIDKAKTYGKIDLFLLFSLFLQNDCDLFDSLQEKIDYLSNTPALGNSVDLKCLLKSYLDDACTIIRFYNAIDPNLLAAIFNNSEIKTAGYFYVSEVNQSVWQWDAINLIYIDVTGTADLNSNCICEIDDLNLTAKKVMQVIINNLCKVKSTGVISACNPSYKVVPFDTINPNNMDTNFIGDPQIAVNYYISSVNNKFWKWVPSENSYILSVAQNEINIEDLATCITDLKITLQDWIDQYQIYEEPTIVSCLSETPNQISTHVRTITDPAVCTLNSIVGSRKDVLKALTSPCVDVCRFTYGPGNIMMFESADCITPVLNAIYQNIDTLELLTWNGTQYVPYFKNIAQIETDQWSRICDILTRVKNVETTCCTPSCNHIKLGFSSAYDFENNVFILSFTKAAGTSIPEDFEDCGTTLIATDWKGNNVYMDVEITVGAEIEVDVSTLDISKPVTITMKGCFSNDEITCKKCYSQLLPAINLCLKCQLCAEAIGDVLDEDFVEVHYATASNPSIIRVKLTAGQCLTFDLPDELPVVKYIRYTSKNIQLVDSAENPCDVPLPAPIPDSCWAFRIPYSGAYRVELKKIVTTLSIALIPEPVGVSADVDLIADGDYTYMYSKLNLYLGSYAISGFTTNNVNFNGNLDTVQIKAAPFVETIPEVLHKQICFGQLDLEWKQGGDFVDHTRGWLTGIGWANTGTPAELPAAPDFLVTRAAKLVVGNDMTDGLILKLKIIGQPPPGIIPPPEIGIKDPVTGYEMFLKGEYLPDDCDCPTN